MSKRLIVIYFASLLLIIAVAVVWFVTANHRAKATSYNIDRLVATGVAREKIYWQCLGEHNKQRQNEWMQSEEYKKEQAAYDTCADKAGYPYDQRDGFNLRAFGYLACKGPGMKWQEWNELSSPECAKIADESEAGKIMVKFRKEVPLESLTNDELRDKIFNLR